MCDQPSLVDDALQQKQHRFEHPDNSINKSAARSAPGMRISRHPSKNQAKSSAIESGSSTPNYTYAAVDTDDDETDIESAFPQSGLCATRYRLGLRLGSFSSEREIKTSTIAREKLIASAAYTTGDTKSATCGLALDHKVYEGELSQIPGDLSHSDYGRVSDEMVRTPRSCRIHKCHEFPETNSQDVDRCSVTSLAPTGATEDIIQSVQEWQAGQHVLQEAEARQALSTYLPALEEPFQPMTAGVYSAGDHVLDREPEKHDVSSGSQQTPIVVVPETKRPVDGYDGSNRRQYSKSDQQPGKSGSRSNVSCPMGKSAGKGNKIPSQDDEFGSDEETSPFDGGKPVLPAEKDSAAKFCCVFNGTNRACRDGNCGTKKKFVSQLERHHVHRHGFIYCRKCFRTFANDLVRKNHVTDDLGCCHYCVTPECPRYGSVFPVGQFECTHDSGKRDNTQEAQWNRLRSMALDMPNCWLSDAGSVDSMAQPQPPRTAHTQPPEAIRDLGQDVPNYQNEEVTPPNSGTSNHNQQRNSSETFCPAAARELLAWLEAADHSRGHANASTFILDQMSLMQEHLRLMARQVQQFVGTLPERQRIQHTFRMNVQRSRHSTGSVRPNRPQRASRSAQNAILGSPHDSSPMPVAGQRQTTSSLAQSTADSIVYAGFGPSLSNLEPSLEQTSTQRQQDFSTSIDPQLTTGAEDEEYDAFNVFLEQD